MAIFQSRNGIGYGLLLALNGAACALGCGADDGNAPNGGGGSGGTGTPGGGAASTVTSTCSPQQAKLAYDGGAEQTYTLKGWPALYSADKGTASRIFDRMGMGQYQVVFEPQLDMMNFKLPGAILDTKPWPVRSALLADATEQTLGPIRCVAPGSGSTLARKGDDLLLDLKKTDVMAACGDHPVAGQINLCFEFLGCDPTFDGGSVAGTPWVLQPDEWLGGNGAWHVDFNDGSYMNARTTNTEAGPAYWALIVTEPSGPYSGQIFCASGGTIEKTPGDFGYTVMHWTSLGTVPCGVGTGTARGCLNGNDP
jgi:hypothetical protein